MESVTILTEDEMKVFEWMESHADGDGIVDASARTVAHMMGVPSRTVQGILQRLEQKGEVYLLGFCKYAVRYLAEDDDELPAT